MKMPNNERLYTYDELTCEVAKAKEAALYENHKIKQKYDALCKMLKAVCVTFDDGDF
jgi:hypothetical protein